MTKIDVTRLEQLRRERRAASVVAQDANELVLAARDALDRASAQLEQAQTSAKYGGGSNAQVMRAHGAVERAQGALDSARTAAEIARENHDQISTLFGSCERFAQQIGISP